MDKNRYSIYFNRMKELKDTYELIGRDVEGSCSYLTTTHQELMEK